MTYYAGGKKRIGKKIADIIVHRLKATSHGRKIYIEPFCGMLGVFRAIPPDTFEEIHLADRNPAVIQMWKAIQNGWIPPTQCGKAEYEEMKASKEKLTPHSIFCGYAMSQRGSLFSTYCTKANLKNQRDQILNIAPLLEGVKFRSGDYQDTIPTDVKGAVIYCDPPYLGTGNKYQINRVHNKAFDYERFWDWCILMSKKNDVYVSEYTNLPPPAQLIWASGKEKLYRLRA